MIKEAGIQDDVERLLFSAEPYPDESFFGYLLRLTELNDYDTFSWIFQLAQIKTSTNRALSFCLNPKPNLLRISQLTDIRESKLLDLTYRPVGPIKRGRGNFRIFGQVIPCYVIQTRRPKICTACLRDSGYLRKLWELAPVTTCPIHKCLLIDECPSCMRRISWERRYVGKCKCGFDWRKHAVSHVTGPELDVTRHIHQLCNIPISGAKTTLTSLTSNNPLRKLNLKHFLSALFLIGSQSEGFLDTMGKRIGPSKRNTEVHRLLCKATSAFIDWPESFYTFLEQLRANNEGKGYWGIGKHFDKLNHALNTQLKSGQFAFMRNAFNKYLLNRWDGACASTISRLNKIARHKSKYVSMAEAKTILAVAGESIDHFLVTGRLKGIVRKHEGFRQYLIERSSVIDLKRELEQSLCMKQVASALGLDSKRVLQLSNAGVLNLRGGPAVDGHSSWVFSGREVVGLLRKIRKRISRSILSPPNKVVSFNLAVRKLSYAGVGLPGFIIAVRDGELRPCGEGGKNKGLRKLIFNSQDISSYIDAYKRKEARDVFRVSELPNELGLPQSVIRSLLKTGILSARKAINGFRYETVITKIDLDAFSSNYVVLSKIARELHSKVDFISRLLAKRGISPVPCNAVNGRILYVFRKSDLKSVNLSRLVASARARSALERNRAKTVEAKAAAEILGTDVATVRQLIENGVLTTYGTSLRERSQQKIYLAVSTINKYRGRINDYLGLVTVKVAAKMLGISKSGLLATYVWKGRLRTFRLGGKQKPQYFKKEEVEALAVRRRQTVKSPEAAKMLGVGETCVHKLKLTGALKPISGPDVDGYSLNLYLRDDVERLRTEREAFKEKCVKEGKKARYGSRAARPRPVRDVIGPRIEQLLEQWNKQWPDQHISGGRLYRQLISEGYKLGIVAVYVYLRQRQSEAA